MHVCRRWRDVPVVPDTFWGGSAPDGIPYPGLPKLLLYATHLVHLHLSNIPHSGYFSPDAMVTPRRSPPPIRLVLSTLTEFRFKGLCEHLDAFVALIDAPGLDRFDITFFNDIVFDAPHFIQFISRTPTLKTTRKRACCLLGITQLRLVSHRHLAMDHSRRKSLAESWIGKFRLLNRSVPRACLFFPERRIHPPGTIFATTLAKITSRTLWLELLHPFTVLKSLHLSKEFVPRIAPALQELVGSRTTEVLPTLQNILLEDSSHWNLSKKALRNPLLHDNFSVTLCFPLGKIKRPPLSKYRTILVSCCLLKT